MKGGVDNMPVAAIKEKVWGQATREDVADLMWSLQCGAVELLGGCGEGHWTVV